MCLSACQALSLPFAPRQQLDITTSSSSDLGHCYSFISESAKYSITKPSKLKNTRLHKRETHASCGLSVQHHFKERTFQQRGRRDINRQPIYQSKAARALWVRTIVYLLCNPLTTYCKTFQLLTGDKVVPAPMYVYCVPVPRWIRLPEGEVGSLIVQVFPCSTWSRQGQ